MPQQGLMLMILIMIIIPFAVLFTSHDIFFAVLAVIMLIISIRNFHAWVFNLKTRVDKSEDEISEEMEELINLDVKKFGKGTKVVRNLIAVVFYIYCSFFVYTLPLKMLSAMMIVYWIYATLENISKKGSPLVISSKCIRNSLKLISSAGAIVLIFIVFCIKFFA